MKLLIPVIILLAVGVAMYYIILDFRISRHIKKTRRKFRNEKKHRQ